MNDKIKKNSDKLVSLIIPVYNQKAFLKRCLDSVLAQTYQNLEIIIIDDGSTDGSDVICNNYANIDIRIQLIHKENGGVSSARNIGLELAKGDYVTFLDSDDYLVKNYIKDSVFLCERYDADISILNMVLVNENENKEFLDVDKNDIKIMNAQTSIEEMLYQKIYTCCVAGKLYKHEVIENIHFPVGKVSEDLAVCYLILDQADKVVYSNKIGYYYRQQSSSIMHNFNSARMDALKWAKEIECFCEKKYPSIAPAARCRKFNVAVHLLLDLPDSPAYDEYRIKLLDTIKSTRTSVIINKNARFRDKCAAFLTYFGERTLKKVWKSKFAIHKEK